MHGVIIFGKPCSGKSTIGKEFAKLYDYEYISSGDIARQMADENPEIGALLAVGRMAPEVMMRTMIKHRINQCINHDRKFVLDGFPRFKYQDMYLDEMFPNLGIIRVLVDIPDDVARNRAMKRNRDDDGAFETRLKYYHDNTEELTKTCAIIIDNDNDDKACETADKLYLEVCECLR